jgi:hypothetical protein
MVLNPVQLSVGVTHGKLEEEEEEEESEVSL